MYYNRMILKCYFLQLSVGTQRLEELAIKQSRQLIPMMPSTPKTLVRQFFLVNFLLRHVFYLVLLEELYNLFWLNDELGRGV